MNANKKTILTLTSRYGKLNTKRKNKVIPPLREREVEKYEQTVSADLKEEKNVVAP